VDATILFPATAPGWSIKWNRDAGKLHIAVDVAEASARVLRLSPR
jgi:hypothetical protein